MAAATKNRERGSNLVSAAKTGDLETVQSLLRNGADINYTDKDGWSALLAASCEGHTQVALHLITAKADVHDQYKFGKTALHWAAEWGREELVTALLDAGADIDHKDGNDGKTAIMSAVFQDQAAVMELLLKRGANLVIREDKHGWTVLHGATRYGRVEMVDSLLEAGCEANAKDKNGWTPLIYAAEHGHTDAVLSLMSHGADTNTQTNDGYTALHYTRRADIALMLLETGADPNLRDKDGNTALHCAAKNGGAEVVRSMLDHGADRGIKNLKGKTAAQVTNYEIVRTILAGSEQHGAGRGGAGVGVGHVPRYARGTVNVAAAPATFSKPKPINTINTSNSSSNSTHYFSTSSGGHTPPAIATNPSPSPLKAAHPQSLSPAPAAVAVPAVAAVVSPRKVLSPVTTSTATTPTAASTAVPVPGKASVLLAPINAAAVTKPVPASSSTTPTTAVSPVPAGTAAPSTVHVTAAPAQVAVPPAATDIPTLLKEALTEGTKEWRRSKFSVVGEGRAGKTAFTNTIIGRPFAETSSTVGINQLTCDVKQVRTSGGSTEHADWAVTSKAGRELENALAQLVARRKRRQTLGQNSVKAASCMDIRTYLKEQEEGQLRRVDKSAVQAHLFKTATAPVVAAKTAAHPSTSGGAWVPKHASAGAASPSPAVGAWTPKKKADLEASSPSKPQHSINSLSSYSYDSGLYDALVTRRTAEVYTPPPCTLVDETPDEELVMRALANIQDDDSNLLISLFDFGGQSVFDVIHHLFLTRNGVYALVFNMEWLVKEGPEKDKALRFMRNWLSSVAVHTYDEVSNTTAPIVFVGTRLDLVASPAKHAAISTLLYEQFSDNIAWKSVLENENGQDANGKAFQWFFPVDNKRGKQGPTIKNLMSVVHHAMEGAAYTHKEVPLSWFKVMDHMADTKKDCLSLPDVTALAARCQVAEAEVPYLLAFLHDMGHLMWLDEPGLRDVVVLDPVSYLVTPATIIICKITPDRDDPTHHFMASHRECERLHKREWMQLKQEGILHVSLLPILWKAYQSQQEMLLQLMVKFGLLVPLRTSRNVKSVTESSGAAQTVLQYLVPTLLSLTPVADKSILIWTEAAFSSCYFVFTLTKELSQSTNIAAHDLQSSGFLPGGMFERIVGKALSWSQDTAKGSGVNLQSVLLHKDMAVMAFGGQRFRLVNCSDIHCVRVDIEGSNPLGIQQKLQDFVSKIIEECMPSLHCFPALLYSSSARDSSAELADPLQKTLLPSELLIPLQQLREASKGESVLTRRGGRTLLTTAEIKSHYDQWLQLYELRNYYDIFLSYRWGPHDSDFTEAIFDMCTNFIIGTNKRAIEVFLDRKRLQDGRRFKMDLATGLTHSLIAVPVVSIDALKRMTEHTTDTIDNVLLEWIIILECVQAKRLHKVFPILFGTRVSDMYTGGIKVMDFFLDRTKDQLPRLIPVATLEQCRDLLSANNVPLSRNFSTYTVYSIVDELLQFLLCKANTYDTGVLTEVVTDKLVSLLQDCGEAALGLVASNALDPSTMSARAVATGSSTTNNSSTAAATTTAAPKPSSTTTRPLEELSTADLCTVMDRIGLKMLVDGFRSREMTGALLSYCEDIKDLQSAEYGISNGALARGLLKHIQDWKEHGVPM